MSFSHVSLSQQGRWAPHGFFFHGVMSISSPADGACYEKCIELRDHAGVAEVASAGPSASQILISQRWPVY